MRRFLNVLSALLVLLGLYLVRGAFQEKEPEARTVPASTSLSPLDPTITFVPLEDGEVLGGEATSLLPGTPAEILAALTDFEAAAVHRSFANDMKVLSQEGDHHDVALTLKGRVGVNPTIHVRYTESKEGAAVILSYALTKKALGMAHYEGRYKIEPVEGTPPRSRFSSRIFLSSGISLMKIDHEDIEEGQRTDQRELRAWMNTRLQAR